MNTPVSETGLGSRRHVQSSGMSPDPNIGDVSRVPTDLVSLIGNQVSFSRVFKPSLTVFTLARDNSLQRN